MKKLNSILLIFLLLSTACTKPIPESTPEDLESVPGFKVDPFWPKPLPNNWLLGQVAGIAIDSKDHIWIVHRPKSLGEEENFPNWSLPEFSFVPAPPVMEFDMDGNMIQAWGGPGEGYDWPEVEHGICMDHQNNVWIGGEKHQVLKFTSDGKFLLQIGRSGETGGSNDKDLLGSPTAIDVDSIANEVYVSDGYVNKRAIVFDASTGEYKRHWGGYGNKPIDGEQDPYDPNMPPPEQFGTVHSLRLSHDGLVYVCDRGNNRIQVFQKDGTFVFEQFVAKNTPGLGSVWDIGFSPDPEQKYVYVADGANQCVWILEREDLKTIGHLGQIGRYAGQFIWIHNVAVDSKGNVYTSEVYTGKRVQKFLRQ